MPASILLRTLTPPEHGQDPALLLYERALEGARRHFGRAQKSYDGSALPQAMSKRLGFELELISRTDSAPLFLMAADLALHCRQNGNPISPGLGHTPSSLVAYVLGITTIDPLQHELLFEQIINPDDPRPPHLGVAVGSLEQAVAHLHSVHGNMLGKPCPNEVTEALELWESPVLMILKRFLERVERKTGKRPKLEEIPETDPVAWALLNRGPFDILRTKKIVESGLMTEIEVEACGFKPNATTNFGGWDCDRDFPVTSIEQLAIREILTWPKHSNSWALCDVREELVARRNGKAEVLVPHPLLEPVLAETWGVMVYQEQMLRAVSTLTGWSLGRAELFRKAMGRARPDESWKWSDRFVEASMERGRPLSAGVNLATCMADWALTVRPKSHHLGEALDLYRLAWVVAHHPDALRAQ